MYSLVVLCLLSAAVALPTPELLHTNSLPPPPPPELKSEEKDIHSKDKPNPLLLDKPESVQVKNPLESADKPKVENEEDKKESTDGMKVIHKESKESKDSKEKSKESKDSKEISKDSKEKSKEDIEMLPEEQKKEKYEVSEESKEGDQDGGPLIVHVISKPSEKGFLSNWLGSHLPWPLSFFATKFRNGDQQPIYIVRESDLIFDDD